MLGLAEKGVGFFGCGVIYYVVLLSLPRKFITCSIIEMMEALTVYAPALPTQPYSLT